MKLKFKLSAVVTVFLISTFLFTSSWLQVGDGVPMTSLTERQGHRGHFEARGHHLNVLRKDLDASNYTSDSTGVRSGEVKEAEAMRLIHDHLFPGQGRPAVMNKNTINDVISLLDIVRNGSQDGNLLGQLFPDRDVPALHSGHQEIKDRQVHPKAVVDSQVEISNEIPRAGIASTQHISTDRVELGGDEFTYMMNIQPNHRKVNKDVFRLNLYPGHNVSSWRSFQNHISQHQLYSEDDPTINRLLHELATGPVVDTIMKSGGTQLKLTFYYSDDGRAMFKPQRFPREQADTWVNHFYFSDFERHHAEIAAFHLDRLLGFRRAIPSVGRFLNVTSEIKDLVTQHDLLKTFFTSPAGNQCFHGQCSYYCDTGHAVCGEPDMLQGVMMAYLPTTRRVERTTWRHPWRRSYHKRKKSEWETDNTYCSRVRRKAPYNAGRRLLDVMDMSIFDFLTGNLDRHHYETLSYYGNHTFPLHLDQGRAFGKPYFDDISILAPVYQCCLVRHSTLQRLLHYYKGGPSLSSALRQVLSLDPVTPVLLEPHLKALDRRLIIILKTVYKCLQKNKFNDRVVIDDGF